MLHASAASPPPIGVPDPNALWVRDRRVDRTREALRRHGIESDFVETAGEALQYVLDRLPAGAVIGLGGSSTLRQIGLWAALDHLGATVINHQLAGLTKAERHELRRRGLTSDFYVMSCNAIAETGAIVVLNEAGNAVAALAFGAKEVVIVASTQKLVPTVDAALARAFTEAAPAVAHRSSQLQPPCHEDGVCRESVCDSPNRLCNKALILYGEAIPGRVRVLMVGQPLGF